MEVEREELDRLQEIESLVRELFELEADVGALHPRAVSEEDERDGSEIEAQLKALIGLPPSSEPEPQHQLRCPYPVEPCDCRRSHLLAEARRLARMIPGAPTDF
jgi:hypothetical protein